MNTIRGRNVKRRWRARSGYDLIREIYLRLLSEGDPPAVKDPLGSLTRIASEVEEEWRTRLRPVSGSEDEPEDKRGDSHGDSHGGALRTGAADSPPQESIREAFQSLPEQQREALLLHVNERMPYPQIAERMGLEPDIIVRELSDAYSQLWLNLYGEAQPGRAKPQQEKA